jgi:hypothetical protein
VKVDTGCHPDNDGMNKSRAEEAKRSCHRGEVLPRRPDLDLEGDLPRTYGSPDDEFARIQDEIRAMLPHEQ